ncbi:MATE family efflux transporter [Candidatus Phytoplasma melaleucae]|uniref:MATE family efflux transporter n=1 Tax=Candidatus Phytoplasma melaleucae TaxID=2982630 RepID=A0ABT9DDG9_9MOLU|nr:MATE family efflux transporter ['Melaleuca sp.' phytoplasma]MDO8167899.1 MATE family efflux transporter ['Melaleuca sp.' phytoplasma]
MIVDAVRTKTPNSNENQYDYNSKTIFKNLMFLAFPIAIYLLFQHIITIVDFYIISNSKSTLKLDALVVYMKQIKGILSSIAVSLGGASLVLVAREYQKTKKEIAQQYATLAFLLSVIISCVIFVIFYLGAQLPSDLGNIFYKKTFHSDNGFIYYNILLLTFVSMTINSVFLGLEIAKNRSRFVLILNILNIICRICLSFAYKKVYRDEITVVHLSYADLFSNLFITILAFYFMLHPKNDFRLQLHKLLFPKKIIKEMLKLSCILMIGKTTYQVGKKIILDCSSDWYGSDLVAIAGLSSVINGIFYVIAQSLEDAQTKMVSQNADSQNNKRTFKIFQHVLIITFIIGILGILTNYYFGTILLKKIKPNINFDMATIFKFKEILFWEQISLFTSVWTSMIMVYMVAYRKNANIVLCINILRIIIRIFFLWFFHKFAFLNINSYRQFGLSTFASNTIIFFIIIIIFILFLRKNCINTSLS